MKPLLIDVRTPAEFASIHVQGSFNVPLDTLPEHITQLKNLKEPLVLLCHSGNRANKACQILQKSIPGVQVLGGLEDARKEGFEIITGKSHWSIDRQVRFVAGLLVLIGLALGLFVNSYWYIVSAFIGAGLTFSGITNFCGMAILLSKLSYNRVRVNDDISALMRKHS